MPLKPQRFVRYIYTLLVFSAIVLLTTSVAKTYCPPYFAHIDSITNGKECLSIKATSGCGGEVMVENHCSGEFYFYDQQGNMFNSVVMINHEEWKENYEHYEQLEDETNRKYWGSISINGGSLFSEGRGNQDCSKGEVVVDGKNICEESNLESGDTVKYWEFKIFSKEDNQDVIIKGRNVYDQLDKSLRSVSKENVAKLTKGIFPINILSLIIALGWAVVFITAIPYLIALIIFTLSKEKNPFAAKFLKRYLLLPGGLIIISIIRAVLNAL